MRTLEVVKKAKAATSRVAAVVKRAVMGGTPKVKRNPFDNETARRERVNAEAAQARVERARVLDELMGSGGEGGGFLGPRRRGWLR